MLVNINPNGTGIIFHSRVIDPNNRNITFIDASGGVNNQVNADRISMNNTTSFYCSSVGTSGSVVTTDLSNNTTTAAFRFYY